MTVADRQFAATTPSGSGTAFPRVTLSDAQTPRAHRLLGAVTAGIGGFYLTMAGVNIGLAIARPTIYQGFADQPLFEWIHAAWNAVFMAQPAAWAGALAAGEILIGISCSSGDAGRCSATRPSSLSISPCSCSAGGPDSGLYPSSPSLHRPRSPTAGGRGESHHIPVAHQSLSKGLSTKGLWWSAAHVLAFIALAGFTVATWGLFQKAEWWEMELRAGRVTAPAGGMS